MRKVGKEHGHCHLQVLGDTHMYDMWCLWSDPSDEPWGPSVPLTHLRTLAACGGFAFAPFGFWLQ